MFKNINLVIVIYKYMHLIGLLFSYASLYVETICHEVNKFQYKCTPPTISLVNFFSRFGTTPCSVSTTRFSNKMYFDFTGIRIDPSSISYIGNINSHSRWSLLSLILHQRTRWWSYFIFFWRRDFFYSGKSSIFWFNFYPFRRPVASKNLYI